MKNYSCLKVHAPTCTRYYINGKRVSRAAYDALLASAKVRDCLYTTIENSGRVNETVRHYCEVRK
jgi:hypothetical protein